MPNLKIRPKAVSMHGRQQAIDHSGRVLFSIAKISRIKTMSLRHNLEICAGETGDMVRSTQPVLLLSKLHQLFFGCFDLERTYLDYENK